MLHKISFLTALASSVRVTHEGGLESTKSAPLFGDSLGPSVFDAGGMRRRSSSSFGSASSLGAELDGLSSTFHEVQSENATVQSWGAPGLRSFSAVHSGANSSDQSDHHIKLTIPAKGIPGTTGGNQTLTVGIEITIEDGLREQPDAPKDAPPQKAPAEPVQVATGPKGLAAPVHVASPARVDLPQKLARQEIASTVPEESSAPVQAASPPLPELSPGQTIHERFERTYQQMFLRQKQGDFNGPTKDEEHVLKSMWDANAPAGHIDNRKQLLDLLLLLGQPPENEGEDLDETFKEWDTKGDGVIDYDEYLNEMITRVKHGEPLKMKQNITPVG